jgi:transcriptional regulator with XRE-family HTH domain
MGKSAPETDFNAVFRLRTRQAREKAGLTQAEVAAALDVDLDKYKKWENRETSAIPRDKMYPFAIVARCDLSWLLSPPTRQELAQARQKERIRA